MKNFSKSIGVCAFALAASCSVTDDGIQKVNVTEPNDLGVTALQTTRVVDNGNDVLTIRALSADDQEVASVQLTIGEIPDLPPIDEYNRSSELVVSVAGGDSTRTISRDIQHWTFRPLGSSAQVLGLTAVSSVLEREANIVVMTPKPAPTTEVAEIMVITFTEAPCPAADLNAPPKAAAGQACHQTETIVGAGPLNSIYQTVLATGQIGVRNQYGPTTACTNPGGASCGGMACLYGPNGWTLPSLTNPPAGQYPLIEVVNEYQSNFVEQVSGYGCYGVFVSSPPTPTFANVTGTFPSNCGCCGNGAGVCCGSACTACSATKSAAAGAWDI